MNFNQGVAVSSFAGGTARADPEGGQGVRTPMEYHKLYGSLQGISNWTPPFWKKLDHPPWKMLDPLWNLEKMMDFFEIDQAEDQKK